MRVISTLCRLDGIDLPSNADMLFLVRRSGIQTNQSILKALRDIRNGD